MVCLTVASVVVLENIGISYVQKFDIVFVVVVLLGLCREEVPQDVTDDSELHPVALIVVNLAESLVGFERELGVGRSDDVNNLTVVILGVPVTVFKSQITQEVEKSNDTLMRFAEVSVGSQYNQVIR